MKTLKRLFIGLMYSLPFVGLAYYLVHLFIVDPKMVEVIRIAGYVTFGGFLVLINLFLLLGIFSSSLMALKHLLNLNVTDKVIDAAVDMAVDKMDEKLASKKEEL